MKDKGRLYGKRSQIIATRPKIYNPFLKEKFANNHKPHFKNNLLRCEIVTSISYLRKIRKGSIGINSMKDLTNPVLLGELGNLLSDSMKTITFRGTLPKCQPKEISIYYFFKHASESEKQNVREQQSDRTYRRWRKIYKELENEKSIRDNDLPERVLKKWIKLSSS